MIRIVYCGNLKDEVGIAEENLTWQAMTVADLIRHLRARDDTWHKGLSDENIYKLAINQNIIHDTGLPLQKGDIVYFLPPVTGG